MELINGVNSSAFSEYYLIFGAFFSSGFFLFGSSGGWVFDVGTGITPEDWPIICKRQLGFPWGNVPRYKLIRLSGVQNSKGINGISYRLVPWIRCSLLCLIV
jgi:hypothetical protein